MEIDFNKYFDYRDGNLYWKVRTGKRNKVGARAGSLNGQGYRYMRLHGKAYPEHRVIWEMHYGSIPDDKEIDHINRIRDDNRIENLRLVTHRQNKQNNQGKNYCYSKQHCKWRVFFSVDGKQRFFGYYPTEEEAKAVADNLRPILYGETARVS